MSVVEKQNAHWKRIYRAGDPREASWYEPIPTASLELIEATGVAQDGPVIDVGGGTSTLVDCLLAKGFTDLTVLDIAPAALDKARRRLGESAGRVTWLSADVTKFRPARAYALWHDRAVFHFLTDAKSRRSYLETLRGALARPGHVILATFGPEGPARCSGLDVMRYSVAELSACLGPEFRLMLERTVEHTTPEGHRQQFVYGWWRRSDLSGS